MRGMLSLSLFFLSSCLFYYSSLLFSSSTSTSHHTKSSMGKNGKPLLSSPSFTINLLDGQKPMTFYNPNNEPLFKDKLKSFRKDLIMGMNSKEEIVEITEQDNLGPEEESSDKVTFPPSESKWNHIDCFVLGLSINDRLEVVEIIKDDHRSTVIKVSDPITEKFLILKVYKGQPDHYSAEIAAFFTLNHERIVRPICTTTVVVNVSVPNAEEGIKMPVTWPALLLEHVDGMNPIDFFFELGQYLETVSFSSSSSSPNSISSPSAPRTVGNGGTGNDSNHIGKTNSSLCKEKEKESCQFPDSSPISPIASPISPMSPPLPSINSPPPSTLPQSSSLQSLPSTFNVNSIESPPSPLKGLSIKVVPFIFAQLVSVILYMQSKGIVYQDMKPDNFIIDNEGLITLIDFDCASFGISQPGIGTFPFIAPEQMKLIRGELYYGVTWWQLAGTIAMLLSNLLAGMSLIKMKNKEIVQVKIDEIVQKLREYTPVHLNEKNEYVVSNLPSQISIYPRQLLYLLSNESPDLRRFKTKASVKKLKGLGIFNEVDWKKAENSISKVNQFPGQTPNQIIQYFMNHIEKNLNHSIESEWKNMSSYQVISFLTLDDEESKMEELKEKQEGEKRESKMKEIEEMKNLKDSPSNCNKLQGKLNENNDKEKQESNNEIKNNSPSTTPIMTINLPSKSKPLESSLKNLFDTFFATFLEKVKRNRLASPGTLKELMDFANFNDSLLSIEGDGNDNQTDNGKNGKKDENVNSVPSSIAPSIPVSSFSNLLTKRKELEKGKRIERIGKRENEMKSPLDKPKVKRGKSAPQLL